MDPINQPSGRPLALLCSAHAQPAPSFGTATSSGKNISFELDTPNSLVKDRCSRANHGPGSVLVPLL